MTYEERAFVAENRVATLEKLLASCREMIAADMLIISALTERVELWKQYTEDCRQI